MRIISACFLINSQQIILNRIILIEIRILKHNIHILAQVSLRQLCNILAIDEDLAFKNVSEAL